MRRLAALVAALGAVGCEREATAPVPVTLTIEASWVPPDSGIVGRRLAGTPAVRIVDAEGGPVAGLDVVFVPTLRAIPTEPYIATTDPSGVAVYTPGWILSGRLGRQELTVFPVGTTGVRAEFGVEAKADTAAQLTLSFGGVVSLAIGDSVLPTLSFRDRFGNPTVASGPVTYSFSDSSVLASSGPWIVAVGSGLSRVEATSGTLSGRSGLVVGSFVPTVSVQRLAARAGFGLAIDPNRILFTVDFNNTGITRLDLATQTALPTIGTGTYWNVAYVPVRDEIWAVRTDVSLVDVFAAASGAYLRAVPLPFLGLRLLPTPDGSQVFVTGYGSQLMRVATGDGSVTSVQGAGDQINGIAFNGDRSRLYTTSVGDGVLREYETSSLALLRSVPLPGYPQEVVFDPLTRRLIVMREFAGLAVLDEDSLRLNEYVTPPSIYGAYGAALSATGQFLIVTTLGGDVNILDAATFTNYGTVSALRSRRVALDPGTGDAWVVQESASELIRITLTPSPAPP